MYLSRVYRWKIALMLKAHSIQEWWLLLPTPTQNNVLCIISTCCSFAICHFKCSSSENRMDSDWLPNMQILLSFIIWKKKMFWKYNSNNIVYLCRYLYSCGVDLPILTELEQLLKLNSYRNCPLTELVRLQKC